MEKFDEKIEEWLGKRVVPGLNYSVIIGDKVYQGSLGDRAWVPGIEPNCLDTIYDLASVTKVVATVTIVSRMIEKGLVRIDDKVDKYLEKFRFNDVTIFHLLTHSSGLPADFSRPEIMPREEVLGRIYAAEKIYETGTDVVYSDFGFILLGEMIAKVYGRSLDIVAREEVFGPLGMEDTGYLPKYSELIAPTEVTAARGVVRGKVDDEKAYSMGGVAGSAGVFSNVSDLTKFVRIVLNDGMAEGGRYLEEATIEMWFRPVVWSKENGERRSVCGVIGENHLVIAREGFSGVSFSGFTGTSVLMDRENNVGIILLTNRNHPSRENRADIEMRKDLCNYIYDELSLKI
ncbi:beta-lactamase family protein [Candidatus Saccharibacteria bacterium]|nr:beta-lactamase family protein [Candidatus Saccharibacteria bacterium]